MDIDCTEDKKHFRVKDPSNQQTWEVWCEPAEAKLGFAFRESGDKPREDR